jgi:hypothetical protein
VTPFNYTREIREGVRCAHKIDGIQCQTLFDTRIPTQKYCTEHQSEASVAARHKVQAAARHQRRKARRKA